MLKKLLLLQLFVFSQTMPGIASGDCGKEGVWLQVLGSGGPELDDGRASTGYLIWRDGQARLLVDMGAGSMHNFEQSGASINDLDAILFSHFHVDHSNDLPAFVKSSFFSDRNRDLYVFGPTGNNLMPSVPDFVKALFGADSAYQYLSSYLDGTDTYKILPKEVEATGKKEQQVSSNKNYQLTAVPVHHGALPALAWQVVIADKKIVFSGDMNNDNDTLAHLAMKADILVAHNAIPEGMTGVARNLHMPPSVIGQIAAKAQVKQLVLSHRMQRTLGAEKKQGTTSQIRKSYQGPLNFADDLQCFRP
ncbi:MBL fold metallo-hydrolase [Kaarinaea lacus]